MNYTISKLVLHNLQAFLPDVGFELTGTLNVSPSLEKLKLHNGMLLLHNIT